MGQQTQSATAPRSRIAEVEAKVAGLAEAQEGLVARRQLNASGVGNGTITRWLERRRLHRRLPGVYSLGHRRTTERGRLIAALLYAGPGAALAGASACARFGVMKWGPRTIEVATPHRRRSLPGVTVRYRPNLERVMREGLPVTPLPHALVDLAATHPRRTLRRALAEADFRRILEPEAVLAICSRGRPGSKALRQALHTHLPLLARTRSELEEAFLRLCERHRIPLPKLNEPIGPYEVDALWPDHRLAVELDGGQSHGRPTAVLKDRGRELYLRERGFRVIRYSWLQVFDQPERVVADLRRILGEAA